MLPGERVVGGLTCSQVLEQLSAYLDGDLDATLRATLESHVASCPMCAQFGVSFSALLAEVRARMATPDPIPASVDRRLRDRLQTDIGS
ncbi:MAG: zf-HC2 domain-containing protein [Vicinamibacterales bacterium]